MEKSPRSDDNLFLKKLKSKLPLPLLGVAKGDFMLFIFSLKLTFFLSLFSSIKNEFDDDDPLLFNTNLCDTNFEDSGNKGVSISTSSPPPIVLSEYLGDFDNPGNDPAVKKEPLLNTFLLLVRDNGIKGTSSSFVIADTPYFLMNFLRSPSVGFLPPNNFSKGN